MRRRDTLLGCMMSRSAFQDASTTQTFWKGEPAALRPPSRRRTLHPPLSPPLPRHNPSPPSCRRPTFSCEFSNFFLFFLSAAVMHSLEEKVGSTKGRFGRREKLHQGRKAKSLTAIFFSFFKLNDAKLQ